MAQVSAAPLRLDPRVAESPVVGIRFLLDGRVSDLGDLSQQLHAQQAEAIEKRAAIRAALRRNEEIRREIYASAAPARRRMLEICTADALELCGTLGELEERITGLAARAEELGREMAGLRQISDVLRTVGDLGDAAVDEDALKYSVASRRMLELADADHGAITERVIEGPVQRLIDSAHSAEVAGRLMAEGGVSGAAAELSRCTDSTHQAAVELENLVAELRPPVLEEGLAAGLRTVVKTIEGVATRYDVLGHVVQLPISLELAIYRIATEALGNALAHAQAERVEVVLSYHRERIVLIVRDDGEGFDVAATEARLGKTHTMGLISMRERAAIRGGSFEIRSMIGAGTEVRATFPTQPV